jgi:Na+/proline symporter
MEISFLTVLAFTLYMLFVLAVGLYAGKYAKGLEGFYLGDRKIGTVVTSISSVASSESAWLTMGFVGEAYFLGLSAVWVVIGCLLGYAFNWFLFALRLRRSAKNYGAVTLPDMLEFRVKDRTHLVRYLAVAVIFLLMFTYVAAQMTAAGKAFRAMLSIDYRLGVLIGAIITMGYTAVGGFRAVSWTDVAQGTLMVIALVVMPIVLLSNVGGTGKLFERLAVQPAERMYVLEGNVEGTWTTLRVDSRRSLSLDPGAGDIVVHGEDVEGACMVRADVDPETGSQVCRLVLRELDSLSPAQGITINERRVYGNDIPLKTGDRLELGEDISLSLTKVVKLEGGRDLVHAFGGRVGLGLIGFLIGMLGIGLGYPGSPHVLVRYMAAKGDREIKRGRLYAMGWGILAFTGALFVGLAARVLLPALPDPDTGLLVSAMAYFHPIFAGLVIAAVFCALLSTADSEILVASSAVVRDVYQQTIKRDLSQRTALLMSRVIVLILGFAAMVLALTEARAIFWFVLFSWAGLGACFGPSLIMSLFWRRTNKWGVAAGIITGFAVTVVWKLWIRGAIQDSLGIDVYELVPAFLLSLLAIFVFTRLTGRNEEAEREYEEKVKV